MPRIAIAANASTITTTASAQPQVRCRTDVASVRGGIDCGTAVFGGIPVGIRGGVVGAWLVWKTSVAASWAVTITWVSLASKPGAVKRRSRCASGCVTAASLSEVVITTVSVSAS
ncbi:Uncharacterised protein [Mycobacterium tuberculosis]|uniref:Uncharacterized protein n=1 Tax=Mycobacterium tuberculosis TaxID=1773 RepID=A0A916LBZ7_MYCTX|nr:Uncharacterised protein [Mycobacterium tuberculosis]